MNNIKIRKIIFIVLLSLITFVINNDSVFAAEFASSTLGSYTGSYCDYEIATGESVYDGKHIYLIYEGNTIKWLNSYGNIKKCDNYWANSGILKLRINCSAKDLKKVLVENNQLTKCPDLYYKVNGGSAPDLTIETKDGMSVRGYSSGILMNGTTVVDDTYTVGKCIIKGNECTTGDTNPTSAVTDITIEKKHSDIKGDYISFDAPGYTLSITNDAKAWISGLSVDNVGNMDCSKIRTLCRANNCQMSLEDFTCDYQVTDPNCVDAENKMAEVKQALEDYKNSINSAKSSVTFADNFTIIASYSKWESANTTVDSNADKFTNALEAYKKLYSKHHSACSSLENFTTYVSEFESLSKDYASFVDNFIQRYEEAVAAIDDEDVRKKYEEQLEDIKDDVNKFKDKIRKFDAHHGTGDIQLDGDDDVSCRGLLGDAYDDIDKILWWVRIVVPIVVILLGSLDFGKAVLADDPKTLSNATTTFVKRCIAALAVFFAPFIIMYLLRAIDQWAGVNVDNCDITELGGILWQMWF